MRERFVRKKKNKTRTLIALANMKRPSVIVEYFTMDQLALLDEAVSIWRKITDYSKNVNIARALISKHAPEMSGLALFTMLSNSKAKLLAQ